MSWSKTQFNSPVIALEESRDSVQFTYTIKNIWSDDPKISNMFKTLTAILYFSLECQGWLFESQSLQYAKHRQRLAVWDNSAEKRQWNAHGWQFENVVMKLPRPAVKYGMFTQV